MQFSKGTFGEKTLESNSLAKNLLKYPEIERAIIYQYPQYSLNFFTNGLGNIANEKLIGSNQYEWWIKGRQRKPGVTTGSSSGNGSNGSLFTVEFTTNEFNPNDVLKFKSGTQAIVIGSPNQTPTGYNYSLKLETNDSTDTFNASVDAAQGLTVGVIGSAFAERSKRGYEYHSFPDKYINYLTTSRAAGSISGDALTDVTWITNNGNSLWFYTDEAETQARIMWEREVNKWYGKATVDANGQPLIYDDDGRPIIAGDGFFEQVDSSNVDTFSGQLSERQITDFLAQLGFESGVRNKKWKVHTGTGGMLLFDRAMKDYAIETGAGYYSLTGTGDNPLGGTFKRFNALGHDITLVENPILDDPNIHGNNIASTGFPTEGHKFVFMNDGDVEPGMSNIEVLQKGAGNINRGMVLRYIEGMVSPFNPEQTVVSSSEDAFRYEYLCHEGLIVRNPKACGILHMV